MPKTIDELKMYLRQMHHHEYNFDRDFFDQVYEDEIPISEICRLGFGLMFLEITRKPVEVGLNEYEIKLGSFLYLQGNTHRKRNEMLQRHNFKIGDRVAIVDDSKLILCDGFVSNLTNFEITAVFRVETLELLQRKRFNLLPFFDETTHQRNEKVLEYFEDEYFHNGPLINSILSPDYFLPEKISPIEEVQNLNFLNQNLNEEQKNAIIKAMNAFPFFLIHGPPGTGKTSILAEYIYLSCMVRKENILVCAHSNLAIDNLAIHLFDKLNIVRLGRLNKIRFDKLKDVSLDRLLENDFECQAAQALYFEKIKSIDQEIGELKLDIKNNFGLLNSKLSNSEKLRKSYLLQEIRTLEEKKRKLKSRFYWETCQFRTKLISNCDVVFATCITAGGRILEQSNKIFDQVIIDEAAQVLEISCWIPIIKAKKLVMAGDHLQLQPIVRSREGKFLNYEESLFERLITRKEGIQKKRSLMLKTQYRMNKHIMNWSSKEFYKGKLEAANSTKNNYLKGKPGIQFVDTQGLGYWEENEIEIKSRFKELNRNSIFNSQECELVYLQYQELLDLGLKASEIGIISMYRAQTQKIKILFDEKIDVEDEIPEISSVDGFQGREKKAIIISLVRSNPNGNVGFLSQKRRMNVAITRAKCFVCLIGDSKTLEYAHFLKNLLKYIRKNCKIIPAKLFIEALQLNQKKKKMRPLNVSE